MINQPAKRQLEAPVRYGYLHSIWNVDADSSYRIVKPPAPADTDAHEYVAVRTISGCGLLVQNGGKRHELRENSVGIFRYTDIRRYEACREGWRFYWFRFRYVGWEEPVNWVALRNISVGERKGIAHCFSGLNSPLQWECMNAEALFHHLLADWVLHRNASGVDSRFSQTITALLEKGWTQRIDLKQLAKEAGMSERSFRDAVHRITGMAPKDYMLKRRMETAMELLQTTTKPVSEVSADLSYDNPFYFSRTFKAYYGISPKQARRR